MINLNTDSVSDKQCMTFTRSEYHTELSTVRKGCSDIPGGVCMKSNTRFARMMPRGPTVTVLDKGSAKANMQRLRKPTGKSIPTKCCNRRLRTRTHLASHVSRSRRTT